MKRKARISIRCLTCKRRFGVIPARAKTAKCCSFKCSQRWKARSTIKRRSDAVRGTGHSKTYIKLNGRPLHRQIAELMLGRKLRKGEIVHHDDRNRRHNDPMNIKVTTRAGHMALHRKQLLAARKKKCGY